MTSKRKQRRTSCTSKVRYTTQEEAKAASRRHLMLHDQAMRTYKCSLCGGFHIEPVPLA